jgi:hypothetical protein
MLKMSFVFGDSIVYRKLLVNKTAQIQRALIVYYKKIN